VDQEPAVKALRRLNRFFFAEEVPYGAALVRIVLPLVLLSVTIPRWSHSRELYSSDGAAAPLSVNYGYYDLVPVPDGTTAVAAATVLILALGTLSLGWCTRLSAIIVTVLYTWLNLLDCMGTMTKYSVIASHILLLLTMSQSGAVWSLDSLLARRRLRASSPDAEYAPPSFPVWPQRLMQLMTGLVYLGAAFTKMHTPAYFSSDQMRQWMLTNVNHSNPIGEYVSCYPGLLVVSAYLAILWEVTFVFLVWRRGTRATMLALGVMFHLGTLFLLGLYIFPLVCFSAYMAFVDEAFVRRVRLMFRRPASVPQAVPVPQEPRVAGILAFLAGTPSRRIAAFALLMLATMVSGVELEHWLDPFRIRQAEGALPLKELDPIQVRQMLKLSPRLRESDKYLSFDLGSDLIGDTLLDRQNVYRYGETVVAQCTLNPPHEDMYIECNLYDADNRMIDRVGQVVDRNSLRATYAFTLTDALVPGTYFLAVRSRGQEITRKPLTLLPTPVNAAQQP